MTTVIIAVVVLAVLGAIFGLVLAIASKVFAVEVDPREEAILGCLPGANCGACGCAGCADYAKTIVEDGNAVNKCVPGGAKVAGEIAAIMGVGAAKRISCVDWGVVKEMVLTWVLTFPGCGVIGFFMAKLFLWIF